MSTLYSNELRAMIVTENIIDTPKSVLRENCLTVQAFSYDCVHKRNEAGEIYGPTQPVIMRFTIRVNSPSHSKPFYQALCSNDHQCYSFIFNATFDNNKRLYLYDNGMMVDAYVLRVEESCDTSAPKDGSNRQILLNVDLQVCAITYLGLINNLTYTFIK